MNFRDMEQDKDKGEDKDRDKGRHRPSEFHRPVNHNRKRRAICHNYDEPGTYLITIVTEGRLQLLGSLVDDVNPRIELSELGSIIKNYELPKITAVFPMVKVWKVCIMPDHIHLIVNIGDKMPAKKHLGNVIGGFKGGCSRAWWKLRTGASDMHLPTDRPSLFKEGYNDGILFSNEQLQSWKNYLSDNPRRLALKRANPDLFKIWHEVTIGQWECQMIGNIFLLDIPDIMAVVVHRADSEEAYKHKFSNWMAAAERGAVLVSAAIAPREKIVMREAMNRGYRLIVLRENGFHCYYKPAGEGFDACVDGRLLQICPWDYHEDNRKIKRSQCLELNALALFISKGR